MSDAEQSGLRFQTARSMNVEELLRTYDGVIDDADQFLANEQIAGPLPIPGQPEGIEGYITWHPEYNDPLPPDDLTEVPDHIIGKLFSFYSNWTNYVASAVTRAKQLREKQKRNLDTAKSALTIYYREERGVAAALIKDYVNVDERFVHVDAAYLQLSIIYETASSREDQLRRTINNISREQTRRANELERVIHDERGGRTPEGRSSGGRAPGRRFGQWE